MARDKEKRVNPATAHLKATKKSSIKKQKNQLAQQRAEKLARRNPDRLQRQIDALNEEKQRSGGALRPRDKAQLEELERDVKRIHKAREMLGVEEKRPHRRRDADEEGDETRERGVLGKRGRDGERRPARESSSDTDSDARDIPMPRDEDHAPPVPRRQRQPHSLPDKVGASAAEPARTTYSSAPVLRDLRKEAVSRFVPSAVSTKLAAVKGEGGRLLEPEEADALEQAGYGAATDDKAVRGVADAAEEELGHRLAAREAEEGPAANLEEEERRFEQELRRVELEEASPNAVVENVVSEAEKELQHRLAAREAADGPPAGVKEEEMRFRQELRRVEMEDVSDEDL